MAQSDKNEIREGRNQVIAQSNNFIRHARTKLTVQEQNIIYFLFSKVKPRDKDFMTINFTIKEFFDLCGMNDSGKNFSDIKNALKSIADKSAWTEYNNEKGQRIETLVRWVDTYEINHNSGQLKATLSQSIKHFLLNLIEHGFYTQAELGNFLALRSSYSKRLYEILKSYMSAGNKKAYRQNSKEFEVADLKKLLGAEIYNRFANFKQRVLDPSVNEINRVTDIEVDYGVQKPGKVTTHVIFTFKMKSPEKQLESRFNRDTILDRRSAGTGNVIIDIHEHENDPQKVPPSTYDLQTETQSIDEKFELLWSKILKKIGKRKAKEIFAKAIEEGVAYEKILAGLDAYNKYVETRGIEDKFIKSGKGWFEEHYWENDYSVIESKKKAKTPFHNFNEREYDWAELEAIEKEYLAKRHGLEITESEREALDKKRKHV